MDVSSLFPTVAASTDTENSLTSTSLTQEDFLTLLIAQLENQDPLNPQDSTEFTAQLAQFSSLEQLMNVNTSLADLQTIVFSQNNSSIVNMLGKTVLSYGNEIPLTSGESTNIEYSLDADASLVDINIYDSNENLVRTISPGSQSAGRQTVAFDGLDDSGNQLASGTYTYEVSATTLEGDAVSGVTYSSSGTITGVSYEDGTAVLLSGDNSIPVANVVEVH
jgi:flagellar basal-body rod modification protein FlgD